MGPGDLELKLWVALCAIVFAQDLIERRIHFLLPLSALILSVIFKHSGYNLAQIGFISAFWTLLYGLGWIGGGDHKWAIACGLYLGTEKAWIALGLSLLLAGLVSFLLLLKIRKLGDWTKITALYFLKGEIPTYVGRDKIPLGCCLSLGGVLALCV